MSNPIKLATPPVVMQGNRHICWAAAFESWTQVTHATTQIRTADDMISRLRSVGATSPSGPILDANERLLTDGIPLFTQLAQMRFDLMPAGRLTADLVRNRLSTGHIWLWGTPAGGRVAHIVVVFGITESDQLLIMDPLHGMTRPPLSHLRSGFQMFGVGTPLFSVSSRAGALFKEMLASATNGASTLAPAPSNPLYPGR